MNIFLVPLNIPELVSSEIFLIRVRLPGGTAIIFAQSWNFELKFFVDNPFNYAKKHFYRCKKLFFVQKGAKTDKRLQSKYCTLLTKNLKLDKPNEQ